MACSVIAATASPTPARGQLIDHFRLDERGVHVEGHEAPVPPVDIVPLHGHVEVKALRHL